MGVWTQWWDSATLLPTAISGLHFWLDAQDTQSLTLIDGAVDAIADKHEGRVLSAPSVADRPSRQADGGIVMDSTRTLVGGDTSSWAAFHQGPGSWIACMRLRDIVDTLTYLFGSFTITSNNHGCALIVDSRSTSSFSRMLRFAVGNGSAKAVDTLSSVPQGAWNDDELLIIGVRYDGERCDIHLNGWQYTTGGLFTSFGGVATSASPFSLASIAGSAGANLTLYEQCFYDRYLQEDEYHGLMHYMMQRHGAAVRPIQPVLLLMGQSNALGHAEIANMPPAYDQRFDSMYLWNDGAASWQLLEAGVNNEGDDLTEAGAELSLAYELAQIDASQTHYLFKYAVGSTSVSSQWKPPSGAQYSEAKNRWLDARQALIDGAIWPQASTLFWVEGETSGADSVTAAAYDSDLSEFVQGVRRDFHPNLQILDREIMTTSESLIDGYATVNSAKHSVAAAQASMVTVDGIDLTTNDNIHQDAEGQIETGRRFVQQWLGRADEPYDPTVDSTLQGWWRASALTPDSLTYWPNEGAASGVLQQLITTYQPGLADIDAITAVDFDGMNDFLVTDRPKSSWNFLHEGSATLYLVLRTTNLNIANHILCATRLAGGYSENGGIFFSLDNQTGAGRDHWFRYDIGNGSGTIGSLLPPVDGIIPSSGWYVISMRMADTVTGRNLSGYVNHDLVAEATSFSAAQGVGDSGADLTVGAFPGAASPFKGQMAEILIKNSRDSLQDHHRTVAYLMEKYGIQ